ncbi:MAG: hypothetical protein IKZ55_00425 [Bacteroidales bacterium]|nr:hypothetical protein [Bacteroidales bacterium]
MKKNDIFEHEAEGTKLRFQLVDLTPNLITIQTLDLTPPKCRSGNMPLAVLPKAALATNDKGEFVTTDIGERWAKRYAAHICNRVSARNKSLRWLTENMEMDREEANALVEKLDKQLDDWEIRYMLAIVRWAYYEAIDPENEADIKRVKDLLLAYLVHRNNLDNDSAIEIQFANLCFILVRKGQRDRILWTMEETERLLRPWANKSININKWVGDSK